MGSDSFATICDMNRSNVQFLCVCVFNLLQSFILCMTMTPKTLV